MEGPSQGGDVFIKTFSNRSQLDLYFIVGHLPQEFNESAEKLFFPAVNVFMLEAGNCAPLVVLVAKRASQ